MTPLIGSTNVSDIALATFAIAFALVVLLLAVALWEVRRQGSEIRLLKKEIEGLAKSEAVARKFKA